LFIRNSPRQDLTRLPTNTGIAVTTKLAVGKAVDVGREIRDQTPRRTTQTWIKILDDDTPREHLLHLEIGMMILMPTTIMMPREVETPVHHHDIATGTIAG